jgi:hypothetical protein
MIGIRVFLFAILIDLLIGDPVWLPHPVVLMGKGIQRLEKKYRKLSGEDEKKLKIYGFVLVFWMLTVTIALSGIVFFALQLLPRKVNRICSALLISQLFAWHGLVRESMRVFYALKNEGLEGARKAVGRIVGRDTMELSKEGIIKATVETVAENFSDGIFAPMFYVIIGGPVLGYVYKVINTMDSMIGYKDKKYSSIGYAAAKLDDLANFIPSRIAGLLIVLASFPSYSIKDAWKIFQRDRLCHASPNSAQTESAVAGALGIQLAGDAYYFGKKYEKPYIGDAMREVEERDIQRVNVLISKSTLYGIVFLCGIYGILWYIF